MTSTVEYQEMLPLASSLQQPAENSSDVLQIERRASRASDISSETDTSNMSSYLERWDDKHVKLLISCYGDHKHLFGKGKTTKREIFSRIVYSFNRQSELMVTGDQCMRKWTKLENKFKETEDHNNQTGNDKRKIKFYDELSECIGSDPKVTPVLMEQEVETLAVLNTVTVKSQVAQHMAEVSDHQKKGNPIHQQQRCCPSCKITVPNKRKLKKRK